MAGVKKLTVTMFLCVTLFALALSGCGCEHTFGNWMQETPATCTLEGKQVRICSKCNEIESTSVPVIEHSYGEWEIDKEATCTEIGIKVKTCSICGTSVEDAVAVVEHTYGEWKIIKAATCTEAGIKTKSCNGCNTTIEESIEIIEHFYGDWKVVKAATCTENGAKEKKCSICETTQEEQISAGHSWQDATCTTPKHCSICGVTSGNALGHSYSRGKCVICYAEDPNYIAPYVTSTNSTLYLDNSNTTIYITAHEVYEEYTVWYEIDDTNIVNCTWGEWDGNTIPLTFEPISTGNTFVTVCIEGYEGSAITLEVSAYKPTPADLSNLVIVGVGQEFETSSRLKMNISVINSAEYEIRYYSYNDTITIEVEVIATMIKFGDPPAFEGYGYIAMNYDLISEDGVYVDTGNLWIDAGFLDRPYSQTIYFFDLEPGSYTLIFRPNHV